MCRYGRLNSDKALQAIRDSSDATAAGAEHGVLVTTGRFSEPARQAALSRHPTIDLVDGEKLTELCIEANIGVALSPVVNEGFFDRFEDLT